LGDTAEARTERAKPKRKRGERGKEKKAPTKAPRKNALASMPLLASAASVASYHSGTLSTPALVRIWLVFGV
jgi:septal ring factor EnvC (AmiA/AmiB activator)